MSDIALEGGTLRVLREIGRWGVAKPNKPRKGSIAKFSRSDIKDWGKWSAKRASTANRILNKSVIEA